MRQLHRPFRMVLSSRIATDQHGSFELPQTAVFASRSAKDIPGRPRTYTDRHAATRITCRIIPDINRVDPASVWE
ncbi:hypothetical protein DPMN_138904 [Dreissena polymorpha]|uniref:Uncharacterized protein n=1 Tax=Dreissena polymorpha TaxID=45954 RepID=A0A9D4G7I9_DREPO|nr:hypothetical protein DPMN_138904 [Dreissena polymorpha]